MRKAPRIKQSDLRPFIRAVQHWWSGVIVVHKKQKMRDGSETLVFSCGSKSRCGPRWWWSIEGARKERGIRRDRLCLLTSCSVRIVGNDHEKSKEREAYARVVLLAETQQTLDDEPQLTPRIIQVVSCPHTKTSHPPATIRGTSHTIPSKYSSNPAAAWRVTAWTPPFRK